MENKNAFPLILFCIILFTTISCSSTKNISQSGARDGSSAEKAIVVKSINAEYKWIAENYPGSKVTSQALISMKGKPYDVLTFETKEGEVKKAYFDISSFFGKF